MPRTPWHALVSSSEQQLYARSTQGQVAHRFQVADDAAWLAWLDGITFLAFHGRSGSLYVYQEQRPHDGRYWYAYHTDRDGIHKRYLGHTAQVTLARLDATAHQALRTVASASWPATLASLQIGESAHQEVEQHLLPVLHATKLTPPRPPNVLVDRPRLLTALDGALSTPLTLLSAMAGWGKTTRSSTSMTHCKRPSSPTTSPAYRTRQRPARCRTRSWRSRVSSGSARAENTHSSGRPDRVPCLCSGSLNITPMLDGRSTSPSMLPASQRAGRATPATRSLRIPALLGLPTAVRFPASVTLLARRLQ
jgi:hypothetical protein